MELVTLHHLLFHDDHRFTGLSETYSEELYPLKKEREKIAALASAIEKHGCYGTDRFGRFCDPQNEEIKAGALDSLAKVFSGIEQIEIAHEQQAEYLENNPAGYFYNIADDWDSPLYPYGWPENKVPPIVVDKSVIIQPKTPRQTKTQQQALAMVRIHDLANSNLPEFLANAGASDLTRKDNRDAFLKIMSNGEGKEYTHRTYGLFLERLGQAVLERVENQP